MIPNDKIIYSKQCVDTPPPLFQRFLRCRVNFSLNKQPEMQRKKIQISSKGAGKEHFSPVQPQNKAQIET